MPRRMALQGDDRSAALREVIRGRASHSTNPNHHNIMQRRQGRLPAASEKGAPRSRGNSNPSWSAGESNAALVGWWSARRPRDGTARVAVLLIVTIAPARVTPDATSTSDVGKQGAALGGALPASMERLVSVVSRSISTPAALIALLGDDRRSFWSGELRRDWFAHDAGALIRCGLMQRTLESGGVLCLHDLLALDDVALRSAAVDLRIASVAAATFNRADGS